MQTRLIPNSSAIIRIIQFLANLISFGRWSFNQYR